jgi:transposase
MRTDFAKENQVAKQILINSDSLLNPLVTIDGERGTKIYCQVFWLKGWGLKKIPQRLMSTFGDDAYGLSQIKIWLQRFRTGYLSYSDFPHAGRPRLTLGLQAEAFLQKYPFAGARTIAEHFLTTASTVREFIQRELGMRKFSQPEVPHSLSDAQKVARVEAAKNVKDFA